MIKKLLIMLVALFLVSSFVVAEQQQGQPEVTATGAPEDAGMPEEPQGAPEDAGEGQGEGEPELIMAQEENQAQNQGEEKGLKEQNKEMLQTGLENALGNVKNENAKQMLQQNMEKFQEMYQQRLEKMEGLEITEVDEETGAVKMKAKEQVKFLGFIKGTATQKFEMDGEGNMVEKKPWYRFMYKEAFEE
ncbi:MAG: hypothetical protein ABH828_00625 [archaeon]